MVLWCYWCALLQLLLCDRQRSPYSTHALWHRRMVLPNELPTSVCMERVITPRLSHTIFRSVAEADAVRHAGGAVPYWD